ncbi:MAG: hypothetical protein ABIG89_01295 [Candidatus Woesearchaeota archaeon]
MAIVQILKSLVLEIKKKFGKTEGRKILELMSSLENNPKKGKFIGNVSGLAVKELKYKNFRFYFITDGFKLKFFDEEKLKELLLRFVRMSDKKHQQEVIDEIKEVLKKIGPSGFE